VAPVLKRMATQSIIFPQHFFPSLVGDCGDPLHGRWVFLSLKHRLDFGENDSIVGDDDLQWLRLLPFP
jgi:hypothetical protein